MVRIEPKQTSAILGILLALVAGIGTGDRAFAESAEVLWSRSVQPLLDVQCVKCHGPIEQKGGLELDHPEAVFKGGDEGPVVVPGRPEESRLFTYLDAASDPHMPPKKQLTDAERAVIRRWIEVLPPAAGATGARAAVSVREIREFPSIPAAVDTLLEDGWRARGVQPTAAVSDAAWVRRVHLDLAGRVPTRSERDEFLGAAGVGKRAELVDRLLGSQEYAVHMRELWDVFLLGRVKRDSHEDRRREKGWWGFLETAFRENRPWDEVVREMLVARGGSPGANWFLYERRNDHQAIAEAVAPLVYGTKIDCAQCHDHPLAREIKQAHYWGLVAAFNRGKNVDGTTEIAESAIGGFVNFTNLKKESQPALITLLDGTTVPEERPAADAKEEDRDEGYVDPAAKPRVPKFSRREAFARAVTRENPQLARAFVNRLWAVLMGRGLVHPVDEINARNAASHPELLEWLTRDFMASGHDVRRLVRGLVLSRLYGLGVVRDEEPEAWAGVLERPLTAEQLARSWRVAAGWAPEDPALRRAAVVAFPEVLPREYLATFQQAQFLSHSPALAALLTPAPESTLSLVAARPDPEDRVREAFLAVYGREADATERAEATSFLAQRSEAPAEAARDLLWALMNSAEFLMMP